MNKLMYALGVTYADFLFVERTENAIESLVVRFRAKRPESEMGRAEAAAAVDALRKIDALSISGRYEEEREALAEQIESHPWIIAHNKAMAQLADHLANPSVQATLKATGNFLAGLRSADAEQQARFRNVADYLGDKTPGEIAPVLIVMEQAKGRKGRPTLPTPWTNEIAHMHTMRLRVAGGETIPAAARFCANAEGRADASERGRTLEKLYRQKIALREQNPPQLIPCDIPRGS